MDSSYPRPITNWEGIPDNLDAATTYTNGKTYFFKGSKYYKFDDEKFELASSGQSLVCNDISARDLAEKYLQSYGWIRKSSRQGENV